MAVAKSTKKKKATGGNFKTMILDGTALKIVQKVRTLFLAQGYHPVSMTAIATACGLTRRALYHHFHDKPELLRAMLVLSNREAQKDADWAARKEMARGGDALDVIAVWLDSRFGATRRMVEKAPGGEDLNKASFSIAHDILIEASVETNAALVALLDALCAHRRMSLKPGHTTTELAQIISDGARGVNQRRPQVAPGQIALRYRRITEAILYGWVAP